MFIVFDFKYFTASYSCSKHAKMLRCILFSFRPSLALAINFTWQIFRDWFLQTFQVYRLYSSNQNTHTIWIWKLKYLHKLRKLCAHYEPRSSVTVASRIWPRNVRSIPSRRFDCVLLCCVRFGPGTGNYLCSVNDRTGTTIRYFKQVSC